MNEKITLQAIAWLFQGCLYSALTSPLKQIVDKLLEAGELLKEEDRLTVPWAYDRITH